MGNGKESLDLHINYNVMSSSEEANQKINMIVDAIEKDPHFEHIGDIISYLYDYDLIKKFNDPQVKRDVIAIVNELLNRKSHEPVCLIEVESQPTFKHKDAVFDYLNENWYGSEDRINFILFFKKNTTKTCH